MLNKKAIYLILAGICLLVYANSLNNAFISDDVPAILKNPQISQFYRFWLAPSDLLNSFSYLILKDNPFIYHLVSIILHSLNTILVFIFLRLFFNTESSFLGASLFAVHPIHTEAVTWISGRGYATLAFFILATYLLYYRATNPVKRFNPFWYLCSVFIFLYFIIHNYSFFFLFPLLLILSDVTFKKWRDNWKWWLPFLLIAIIRLALLHNAILERVSFLYQKTGVPTLKYPLTYLEYILSVHLWLLIWPARLTLCHGMTAVSVALLNYSVFYLILLIILLFLTFKRAKEIFFAISIFILFLAPVCSPVPLVSNMVAERYIYFPSIALSMFVAFLYQKYSRQHLKSKKYLLIILILITSAYAVRTILRNQDWQTPEKFWMKTVEISPSTARAHNKMGLIYLDKQDIKKAIAEFEKAIEINPKLAEAYNNLGNSYINLGKSKEAIPLLKKAVEINPYYAIAHFNLSMAYFNGQEYVLAIKHCDRAIELRLKVPSGFLKLLEPRRK